MVHRGLGGGRRGRGRDRGFPGAAAGQSAASRPNILLIITDDQPKQTQWATSKTFDWIARQGVRFSNGHVTTPLCAPSRASIFSGRYAHNHGVRDNGHAANLNQSTTVQRQLQLNGYRTGLFGKYLNSWAVANNPPGFDTWALLQPSFVDGTYNDQGTVKTISGYTTTVLKNRVLNFIDRSTSDTRPWFAIYTPYASHEPNTPEAKYADTAVPVWDGRPSVPEADRADKPAYVRNATNTLADGKLQRQKQFRSLLSVDDAVQAFKDKLTALGQLDNTLVIYIPDNGYYWADHGLLGKAAPYRQAHEVPFYLSWPAGGYGAGAVDDRIVANIDIAPTIFQAAGIAPTGTQDGVSLFGPATRDHVLTEWWHQGPYANAQAKRTWASYVSETEQYVEYYDLWTDSAGKQVGTGQVVFREYYDLVNDPFQLTNKLHGATPAQEQAWGIPALATKLAAARAS
ncbi:sulfatase [Actinokineospora soli]|uniref:Sulfatase n=1 Tax=Actinokineospora soli TaxID=1048753 RepID=A0ABW2TM40_9PSEU